MKGMEDALKHKEVEIKMLKDITLSNAGALGDTRPSLAMCSPHELPTQSTTVMHSGHRQ